MVLGLVRCLLLPPSLALVLMPLIVRWLFSGHSSLEICGGKHGAAAPDPNPASEVFLASVLLDICRASGGHSAVIAGDTADIIVGETLPDIAGEAGEDIGGARGEASGLAYGHGGGDSQDAGTGGDRPRPCGGENDVDALAFAQAPIAATNEVEGPPARAGLARQASMAQG